MALTVGRELFIIMRISYSELKSHACVLYYGVKRRHSVSYQRIKGSMKTQQEAEPRPRVPAEVICGAAEQRYIWINLQDFVPLHLRVSWLQCQVLSTVLSFGNLFGDKKKRRRRRRRSRSVEKMESNKVRGQEGNRAREEKRHVPSRLSAHIHFKNSLVLLPDMWRFSLKLSRPRWLFPSVSVCCWRLMTRAFAVEMKRWPKNKLLVEVQGQSLRGEKKKKKEVPLGRSKFINVCFPRAASFMHMQWHSRSSY